jgi:hypothetical protein
MGVSHPDEMAERHGRMLARLAELSLSAAEILHERLVTAETNAEARDLGLALQRVSRSVRQTLLLEAKLEKDRRAAAREEVQAAETAREGEVAVRKVAVRHQFARVALEALEDRDEVDLLLEDLDEQLEGYVRGHDFEAAPIEALIGRICKDLGVELPADEAEPEDAQIDPPPAGRPAAAASPRLVQMPDGGWAPVSDSS